LDFYQDIDGLIAGTESLTAELFKSAKKLKVVAPCGTGLNNVDLEAAKELGIKVFITPGGPTQAVAELTIGLIFNLLRRITIGDRLIRTGVWDKYMGNLLTGKTLGILGLGRIGRKIVELTAPFGLHYLAWDKYQDQEFADEHKIKFTELDQVMGEADILTIHLPFAPELENFIGDKQIKLMKKGAFLINAARGGLVDETALYEALKEKKIAGAAIDVFEQEPYQGPLKELDNIILTPHIGSYAREARIEMEIQAAKNLLQGLGIAIHEPEA
jgi:D-3-phosphoglycerate dehydrogenase